MSKCMLPGCETPEKYKGLCGKHYKRQWRHGSPEITLIDMEPKTAICIAPDCKRLVRAPVLGLCNKHYTIWTRHGRLHTIRAAKGEGRPVTTAGYVLLTVDGKRIYEHIHLAEKALGKKLPPKAIVHHMNGKPADNFTPFNLVICPDQAYHLLLHRRAERAKRDE